MKLLNFNQFSINEDSTLSKFGLDRNSISNIHKGERLSHDAELEEIPYENLGDYSTNDLFGVTKDGNLIKIQFGHQIDHTEGNRYFSIIKNSHERSVRYDRYNNKRKFNEDLLIDNITQNWDKYNKIFNIELSVDTEKDEKYENLMRMVSDFFKDDRDRERLVIELMDENIDEDIHTQDIIVECFFKFKEENEGITEMSLDEASHKFLVFIKDNIEDVIHEIKNSGFSDLINFSMPYNRN